MLHTSARGSALLETFCSDAAGLQLISAVFQLGQPQKYASAADAVGKLHK
jgi:hypothetical protein